MGDRHPAGGDGVRREPPQRLMTPTRDHNAWEFFFFHVSSDQSSMPLVWYVALGSAVGGASRFALSAFLQQRAATAFPIGTLVVNVTGSLALGFILRYTLDSQATSPEVRALLTAGFCGGYTTFSTFSYETIRLVQSGDYRRAGVYVALSVVLALAATFVGMIAAGELLAARRSA